MGRVFSFEGLYQDRILLNGHRVCRIFLRFRDGSPIHKYARMCRFQRGRPAPSPNSNFTASCSRFRECRKLLGTSVISMVSDSLVENNIDRIKSRIFRKDEYVVFNFLNVVSRKISKLFSGRCWRAPRIRNYVRTPPGKNVELFPGVTAGVQIKFGVVSPSRVSS